MFVVIGGVKNHNLGNWVNNFNVRVRDQADAEVLFPL